MKYNEFAGWLELMQRAEDKRTGRDLNMDNFGHWLRVLSRRLTWVFFMLGLHGPQILFAHFITELIAIYCVFVGRPFIAVAFWLTSYILDNCDGDLARARGEAQPGWGVIDVLGHLWANMIYWPVLGYLTGAWPIVVAILCFRVVMEMHRGQHKKTGDRYGERSPLWRWIVFPTDITIMYLLYVPFALIGHIEIYLYCYLAYYALAAVGQSLVLIRKVAK